MFDSDGKMFINPSTRMLIFLMGEKRRDETHGADFSQVL